MGALAAALCLPPGSPVRPISLASVKSCYGHTEGTAGLTGLLLAAVAQQQRVQPPVVNLRHINPHVTAALAGVGGGGSRDDSSAAIPRQAAGHGSTLLAGTSSFGMSGVNAHALLAPAGGVPANQPGSGMLPWEQQRYWPVPQQHRLLQLPRLAEGSARFAVALSSSAAQAYLWDHAVSGRALLPGTAMLEMAGAAGASLAEAAAPWLAVAVTRAAFAAPCLLPAASHGGSRLLLLEVELSAATGAAELCSAGSGSGASGSAHLTARVSAAASHALGPPASHTSGSRGLAVLLGASWNSGKQQSPAAACAGRLAAPTADATDAYHEHPAATDASLHLSALAGQALGAAQGRSGLVARIPMSAGIYSTCAGSGSGGSSAWAAVQVCRAGVGGRSAFLQFRSCCSSNRPAGTMRSTLTPNLPSSAQVALPNAAESLTCVATVPERHAATGFALSDLVARDVGSARRQRAGNAMASLQHVEHTSSTSTAEEVGTHATSSEQRYAVVWQAARTAASIVQRRQPLLSAVLQSGQQMAVVGLAGSAHIIEPAAQLLQALHCNGNTVRDAQLWLLRCGIPAVQSCPSAASSCAAAAAVAGVHGMLKSAAAEQLLAPGASVVYGGAAAAAAGSQQFGAAELAAAVFAPVLLPHHPAGTAAPVRPTLGGGSALIAGGLGGLGLLVAAWLQQHAQRLVLLGRSGRSGVGSAAVAALLGSGNGSGLTMGRADVASAEEAAAAAAAPAALQAVVHAGGVLADALLINQTAARLRQVAAPKLAGLQQLWHAAARQPLCSMLLFSSIAGVLGTAGQGGYAAANSGLDAAAAALQQQGCSSSSVQWGAWSGAGMAASAPRLIAKLQRQGYGAVQPASGLATLQLLMARGTGGLAPDALVAAPFEWGRFLAQAGRQQLSFLAAVQPMSDVERAVPPSGSSGPHAAPISEHALVRAAPAAPSAAAVLAAVQQQLADLAGGAAVESADVPFLEAGLDSIGAVELRWAPMMSRGARVL